jgi:hypothetical protein
MDADGSLPLRRNGLTDDELIASIELALAIAADEELHVPVQRQMHQLAAGVLDLFDRLLARHGVEGMRR